MERRDFKDEVILNSDAMEVLLLNVKLLAWQATRYYRWPLYMVTAEHREQGGIPESSGMSKTESKLACPLD